MFESNKWGVIGLLSAFALGACDGDDGRDGSNGSDGLSSLVRVAKVMPGNEHCYSGGQRIDSGLDGNANGALEDGEVTATEYLCAARLPTPGENFNRIASFLVCSQIDDSCDTGTAMVAEIVAATDDGMTLVYTNSAAESVGFVDIGNPHAPRALGEIDLDPGDDQLREPTSVAVMGDYAVVGVNTSADFDNPSGQLLIIDLSDLSAITGELIEREMDLGGQPDSVAVSSTHERIAVVIENERDEEENDGAIPQLPGGGLVVVTAEGAPADWSATGVDFSTLSEMPWATDPEPEYVDINDNNLAVVTLQENNYIALVDLADASVVRGFSAGSVDLTQVDATEESPGLVMQNESLAAVPREPDGVAWINNHYFATADEGDYLGGSRGFTVFNLEGEVVYTSGAELEHLTARLGHYPESRSANKGNEPENAEVGVFGDDRYLFIASERSSLVLVYDAADPANPIYKQALPAGVAPEGVLAIGQRNLLIAASEEDSRDDKIRSVLNIYQYNALPARYPTLVSANRWNATPIPWSALSGLSSDPWHSGVLYAVEDSYYQKNRIFKIDTTQQPAILTDAMRITDTNAVFAAALDDWAVDASADAVDPGTVFDTGDIAAIINDDETVNIDPEGIAADPNGGFWVVSEGAGTFNDDNRAVTSLNVVLKTDATGVIEGAYTLPAELNAVQLRFGFEGVAVWNNKVYIAFQRAWNDEGFVRIGVLDPAQNDGERWAFLQYNLEAPASQNGGWVGLSDISSLGSGAFVVVERDNQSGPDAAIKRLYQIDVGGLNDGDAVPKTLVRDLIGDLQAQGGLVAEKVEGSAIMANGDVYIVNDNDGVEDNSGETQLLNLGDILN